MSSFDCTGPDALALRAALAAQRAVVLQQITSALIALPVLQGRQPGALPAQRLAGIFYGNLIATLTFGTFRTFERDIRWHLALIERRGLDVTLADERALFAVVADAVAAALPDHAETARALFAHVAALTAALRQGKVCSTQ